MIVDLNIKLIVLFQTNQQYKYDWTWQRRDTSHKGQEKILQSWLESAGNAAIAVTIAQGGVLPNIQPVLLPKKPDEVKPSKKE